MAPPVLRSTTPSTHKAGGFSNFTMAPQQVPHSSPPSTPCQAGGSSNLLSGASQASLAQPLAQQESSTYPPRSVSREVSHTTETPAKFSGLVVQKTTNAGNTSQSRIDDLQLQLDTMTEELTATQKENHGLRSDAARLRRALQQSQEQVVALECEKARGPANDPKHSARVVRKLQHRIEVLEEYCSRVSRQKQALMKCFDDSAKMFEENVCKIIDETIPDEMFDTGTLTSQSPHLRIPAISQGVKAVVADEAEQEKKSRVRTLPTAFALMTPKSVACNLTMRRTKGRQRRPQRTRVKERVWSRKRFRSRQEGVQKQVFRARRGSEDGSLG